MYVAGGHRWQNATGTEEQVSGAPRVVVCDDRRLKQLLLYFRERGAFAFSYRFWLAGRAKPR